MSEDESFQDLIRRVRARDEQAAAELVRRYESAIRRAARIWLNGHALNHLVDSTDICQSVLAAFFLRAASGQFHLDKPRQLLKLLLTMAHNKVVNLALKHSAARRNHRRLRQVGPDATMLVDSSPGPSELASLRELYEESRKRLSEEERWLVEQRVAGTSWMEIAAKVGQSPDAVRMQWRRAVDRVAREVGLE